MSEIPDAALRAAESAIRDQVRICLGPRALSQASEGLPIMLSGGEAEAAARAALEAAAAFLAEHIVQRIVENVRHPDPAKQDRGKWTSFPTCMAYVDGHDNAARIARTALDLPPEPR